MFEDLIKSMKYNHKIGQLNKEYNTETLKKTKEYRLKLLDIKLEYDNITQYDFDMEKTRILGEDKQPIDLEIDLLTMKYHHKKIDWIEYCKQKNDIQGKPWVAIRSNDDMEANPDAIQIELVHNNEFINYCKRLGIQGDSDDEISENYLKWFFISNIDDDDLSLLTQSEETEVNDEYVKNTKLNGNIIVR